ncbi:MAG TPA: SDR family NAD(P)-dependent oxidoreductase [Bryobacteraceae bacterium]|jgi:3-oxoacyl-[acyl-carrier protein] reductase
MDLGLKGRVAAVTGGTRGIGLAIAELLAAEGAHVAVCARSEAGVEAGRTRGWFAMNADVTREEDARRFIDAAAAQWGRLDILVNNVGGSLGGGTFTQSTVDQWRAVLDVNVMSTLYASKAAIPHMRSAGWGRIINIASVWGRESGGGSAYNAGKAAVISMSKSMAQDLAKDGILVNVVAPGSVWFPEGGWDKRMKVDPAKIEAFVESDMPLGRFGKPEEVADVVALLASERAGLVTGACWAVDGSQGKSNI